MLSPKITPSNPRDIQPAVADLHMLVGSFYKQCHQCGSDLDLFSGDEQIENWRAGAQEIPPTVQFSGLRCRNGHSTCVGCGGSPVLSAQQIFTPHGVLNHCCSAGRLFGIWILLSRFDERELKSTSPRPIVKKPSLKKSHAVSTPSGVGYAGDHINPYTQFDSMGYEEEPDMTDLIPSYYHVLQVGTQTSFDYKKNEKSKDNLMIETLKLLAKFLPPPEAESSQEINLFRLSLLFDTIIDLLRNDSIEDINKRRELFLEICNFLNTIASSPTLLPLLIDGFPRKRSPGIRSIGKLTEPDRLEFSSDAAPSLFSASANTYRQAKMFLKLVQKTNSTEDRRSSTIICEHIIKLYELLEGIMVSKNTIMSANMSVEEDTPGGSWALYSEENRVTFTDDALVNHRYSKEYTLPIASFSKDRLNTISKEVATMTTSLPEGIFLKIAESRMDVMKVLIIGSEGSPYAGGLYTFDLFLPSTYPLSPPKMSFVLDGNDSEQHSFNPNLHKGGTVCLSILNTWHGGPAEMWQPNKSTILSVLISIQAMILGAPMPWLNEPGMESQGETERAIEHKYLIQAKTIKYAMIAWIEHDWRSHKKEYIWKDIVQTYWKFHGNQAFEYAKEWADENPSLRRWADSNPFAMKKKQQKNKAKVKGKWKATVMNEDLESDGEDLLAKLAAALGIPYEAPLQPMKQEESSENGKRKNLDKGVELISSSHHAKKLKPDSGLEAEPRWVYNGGRSQKEVRAVCKEFGIGHASTIKDTIVKLEYHVNEKGKVSPELASKYGQLEQQTEELVVDEAPDASAWFQDAPVNPAAW